MKYPRIPLFVISAVLATGGFGCFDIKCDEGGKCGGDCLSAGQIPLAGCPYRPCCAGSMINPVTDICESCASKGNRPGTGQDCCTGLQVNATTGLCDICFKLTADCVEGGLPACCEGSLPSAGAYCNILSRCARCSHAGGGCEADADCCPNDDPALICKDRLCQKICASDKECTDTANPICIRGECVPAACSADADCQGLKCCSGDCKADCGYGAADACVITSTGGVVAVGKTVSLKAVGIKGDVWKDGMIVPGTTCLWASSVPSVATVDADGVLTGVAAGKTEIRVRTGNGDFTNPITYTVLAPVTGSVNVYVYDESTGDPVEGAQVKVGAANFMATDANGVSGFDTAANDGTVHVMKDGYTWVSYLGSVNPGYIIFLHKSSSDTAGGFRGKFDYSPIKKDDQLHAGIAAMSISGESLFSMNMNSFFGEMLLTPMNISNPVTVKQCVPVPGGLTGGSNYLKVPDLIPEFRILGDTGLRAAWGFGTVMNTSDMAAIFNLISPFISGSEIDLTHLLLKLLPLAFNMNHAVQSALAVSPVPKIKTPEITCPDGKVVPLVDSDTMADYDIFKPITLNPGTKMTVGSVLTVAELPRLGGTCLSGLIAVGGAELPGMGLVPLGITMGAPGGLNKGCTIFWPPDDSPFNLKDNQLMLRMAPNHDGMEGSDYLFTLLAVDLDQTGESAANPVSAIYVRGEKRIRGKYDLTAKPFMGFSEGTALNRTFREITTPASVQGATFHRYTVSGKGGWRIYTDKAGGARIALPSPPAGVADVLSADAGMKVYAIGAGGSASLGELFLDTGATHINGLMGVMNSYSSITCVDASMCSFGSSCNTACELK